MRGINIRVELIFVNWPNSRKLIPTKSENRHSLKLIPANYRKFGQKMYPKAKTMRLRGMNFRKLIPAKFQNSNCELYLKL